MSDDGAVPRRVAARIPTAEQMRALGAALGQAAEPGDRLLLEGSFGVGKTTLVQGLARGLGVREPVTSPSFVIENQYQGRLRLYHVDLYRLEQLDPHFYEELAEHLFSDGVAVVEWPALLPNEAREGATAIRIVANEPSSARLVEIEGGAPRLLDAAERASEAA